MEILEEILNAISCNTTMHGTATIGKFTSLKKRDVYARGQIDFKIMILILHEKYHKSVTRGAWEAQTRLLQQLRSETTTFPRHSYHRGVSKMAICASHAA